MMGVGRSMTGVWIWFVCVVSRSTHSGGLIKCDSILQVRCVSDVMRWSAIDTLHTMWMMMAPSGNVMGGEMRSTCCIGIIESTYCLGRAECAANCDLCKHGWWWSRIDRGSGTDQSENHIDYMHITCGFNVRFEIGMQVERCGYYSRAFSEPLRRMFSGSLRHYW